MANIIDNINPSVPKENPEDMSGHYSDERLNIADRFNRINDKLNNMVVLYASGPNVWSPGYPPNSNGNCPKGTKKVTSQGRRRNPKTGKWETVTIIACIQNQNMAMPDYFDVSCSWVPKIAGFIKDIVSLIF